jgi:single-strand DNA-binding protein
MLAKVTGLFRLTRDAELTYAQSGTAVLKLGLVNSEKYNDKETTLFLDATAFGKPAEIINQYAGTKGTQIFLTGKLQTDQWTDQSGQKRSKVTMIVEGFDFVSNKNGGNQPQNGQQQNYGQGQYGTPQGQAAAPQQAPAYGNSQAPANQQPQQYNAPQQPQQAPMQQQMQYGAPQQGAPQQQYGAPTQPTQGQQAVPPSAGQPAAQQPQGAQQYGYGAPQPGK